MPKRVDHDERRGQLTDAMLRIASTRGLQSVTMREVAAEAGVSLRVVQYYFTDKRTLMASGPAELAARADRRIRERAAALGPDLPLRTVVELILTAVMPVDEQSRLDYLAWNAYYVVGLTGADWVTEVTAEAMAPPDALENYLVGVLVRAREAGEIDATRDPRAEVVGLLGMANGLSSSVLATQRTVDDALAVLRYHLDRLFDRPGGARTDPSPGKRGQAGTAGVEA